MALHCTSLAAHVVGTAISMPLSPYRNQRLVRWRFSSQGTDRHIDIRIYGCDLACYLSSVSCKPAESPAESFSTNQMAAQAKLKSHLVGVLFHFSLSHQQ
jgi:hypothetical protein